MKKVWSIEVVGNHFIIAVAHVIAKDREEAVALAYKNFGIKVGAVRRVPFYSPTLKGLEDESKPTSQG